MERRPVGKRNERLDVDPLDESERDEVQEWQSDHGDEEHDPSVDQLLEDASIDAEPPAFDELKPSRSEADRAAKYRIQCERSYGRPGEYEPHLAESGEGGTSSAFCQVGEREQDVLTPEVIEDEQQTPAHRQRSDIVQGDNNTGRFDRAKVLGHVLSSERWLGERVVKLRLTESISLYE